MACGQTFGVYQSCVQINPKASSGILISSYSDYNLNEKVKYMTAAQQQSSHLCSSPGSL
jgi:hypothetical protein